MNLYDSIIDGAQHLSYGQRCQLYGAVVEYLAYGREPPSSLRGPALAVFVAIRPSLDVQRSARDRGKRGGRPKKTESQTKAEVSEEGQENEKLTESDHIDIYSSSLEDRLGEEIQPDTSTEVDFQVRGRKARKFVPPTLDEVREYVASKGYHFDPAAFLDYYAASDWHLSNGKPVRSWRQCCSTWEHNGYSAAPKRGGLKRDYSEYAF